MREVSNRFPNYTIIGSEYTHRLLDLGTPLTYIVNQNTEFRCDKVAFEVYGSEDYDWFILLIAGCKNEDLAVGTVLNLPTKVSLDNFDNSF